MSIVEHEGQRYEFVRGSDLVDDGMYLEAYNAEEPKELLLFAFYCDEDGKFTFTAYQQNLPFGLVEDFVNVARKSLPPDAQIVQESAEA